MIYNNKVDLVYDNIPESQVSKRFIFQLVKGSLLRGWAISDVNQGSAKKMMLYNPNIELIQAFMHVLLTCKNEVDQIKNEGARVFTRFLPL